MSGRAEPSSVVIRPALRADAHEAAALLRRSITELCLPDHGNDVGRLDGWLANKTPDHFIGWIDDPLNTIVIAESDGQIRAVGGLRTGEGISLNYVHPDARFSGISRHLMQALEAMLRERGETVARLVSTVTARPFYTAIGYRERALPANQKPPFGVAMEKPLQG